MHCSAFLVLLAVAGCFAFDGVAIESSQDVNRLTLTITSTLSTKTVLKQGTTCITYRIAVPDCASARRRRALLMDDDSILVLTRLRPRTHPPPHRCVVAALVTPYSVLVLNVLLISLSPSSPFKSVSGPASST